MYAKKINKKGLYWLLSRKNYVIVQAQLGNIFIINLTFKNTRRLKKNFFNILNLRNIKSDNELNTINIRKSKF